MRPSLAVTPFLALALNGALAAEPASARPAPQRPDGVQVWVCQPPRDLNAFDTPENGDKKLEISLISPRNGRAAGQVVLASAKPIRGIKAMVSDLVGEDGKGVIAAGQVLVRFPAVAEPLRDADCVLDNRFDTLLTEAPAEVSVRSVRSGDVKHLSVRPEPVGAMQSVWLTVLVPRDAAPGVYRGKVTILAEGLAAKDIPVSIKVHGWTMPEFKDYTCRNNIYQSHEATALRYGVPFWSDKHFDLMGQVLDLTRPIGNGFCLVNLICYANCQGNSESMVRWIDKGEGKYEHDFSVFEKYLDLYEKKLGKPRALLLSVFVPGVDGGRMGQGKVFTAATTGENPVKVSRLDPATGKVTPMVQPLYGSEESAAFWRPVFSEVSQRLKKRGWLDVAAIGVGTDWHPTPQTVAAFQKAGPDFKWFSTAHPDPGAYNSTEGRKVPVAFREHVWGVGAPRKPEYGRPWKSLEKWRGTVWVFSRYGAGAGTLRQYMSLAGHRMNSELILHLGWSGLGTTGADFWNVPGRKYPLGVGVPPGIPPGIFRDFGPAMSTLCITAPGPNGPVSTERLEMYIEGLQANEAITFLLKALDDKKIDGALAAKCQERLTQRAARNLKLVEKAGRGWPAIDFNLEFFDSWQEDDETLFAMCAEVSVKLGGK